ncbi:translocation/assembly module TamB domain-containing protein [Candidatus Sororendozoicomonas aggregata]|uniref:autotransporter assembly complex protein TamB n=1 Tax=Candidatus Sororendozoicomonas aggregata TaxID=3073239 RepID=UPI002ED046B1
MNWLKGTLAFIFLLLLLVGSLLFSHSGNVWLWQQAKHRWPELAGELKEGHLGTGWVFQGLSWNSADVSFSSDNLTLHWQLSALLNGRLLITELLLQKATVALGRPEKSISPKAGQKPTEPQTRLNLPVAVDIETATVTDFSFQQGANTITLDYLTSRLSLNRKGLTADKTRADGLTTQWSGAPSESAGPDNKTVELPVVDLPLAITVNDLELSRFQYNEEQLLHIQLTAQARQHTVTIDSLTLNHSMVNATAKGKLQLKDHYPLSLSVNTTLKPALTGDLSATQHLAATVSGDLMNMALELRAQGPVNATLSGTLNALSPDLPFEASLGWSPTPWPLTGKTPDVSFGKGSLTAKGSLTDYSVTLNTTVAVPSQPPTTLTLKGRGNTDRFQVDSLNAVTTDGKADISGIVNWRKGITWQGTLTLKAFNPELWLPELPGKLNGRIAHTFSYQDNHWALSIDDMVMAGTLRTYPVSLQGSITGNSQMAWNLEQVGVGIGDNKLTVDGSLADRWKLQAHIEGPRLHQLYPGLSGSFSGKVTLKGNRNRPRIDYRLSSPSITWENITLLSVDSTGTIEKKGEVNGKLALAVKKVQGTSLTLDQLKLIVQGSESDHTLSLSVAGDPIGADASVTGHWQNQQWTGLLEKAQLQTPAGQWVLQAPVQVHLNQQHDIAVSEQQWLSGQSRLTVAPSKITDKGGQTAFAIKGLELSSLSTYFPEHFSWNARVSGQGSLHWHNAIPELTLKLSTTPGTIKVNALESQYSELTLDASLSEQTLRSHLNFHSKQLGQVVVSLSVNDVQHQRTLDGEVSAQGFMLGVLTPFVPEVSNITGTLSAKGRFAGSLNTPLFYGDIALNEGDITTTQDIVHISRLNTLVQINGDTGKLTGHMQVGTGMLSLGGDISWKTRPLTGKLVLKGDKLAIKYPGLGEVHLKPDIALNIGTELSLTGKLNVPWARIAIKSLPESAVSRSSDVVIVSSNNNKQPAHQDADGSPVDINVTLRLGQDVHLDAFGLTTELRGNVGIEKSPGKPLEMQGTINLKKGRYHSLGQNLVIKEGQIIFSGPPDNPYLSLKAIRNPDAIDGDVTVGIVVDSPLKQPKWTLFSQPAMSQTEQFSYLLRGRSLDASSEDSAVLQSMLLGLGVSQLGGMVNSIGATLGLEDVVLDTEGSGDETQVTVSGNLSPNIQVQYGIGVFNSVGEVKVIYQLMPRLYLQAVNGVSQALDIFYRFSLKQPVSK